MLQQVFVIILVQQELYQGSLNFYFPEKLGDSEETK